MSITVPPHAPVEASGRPFTIAVRRCKKCGREWPARLDTCSACAVSLGPATEIPCLRLAAPAGAPDIAPVLAAAVAVELVERNAAGGGWEAAAWEELSELAGPERPHVAAPAGTPVFLWPLARGGLEAAAEFALRVEESGWPGARRGFERRGSLAIGVLGGGGTEAALAGYAERLALSAWPGRWLCGPEVARRLASRYRFGGVGSTPRWAMPSTGATRSFLGRAEPPRLPSAIDGERPGLVLGREAERRRILAELRRPRGRRVLLVSADAGGGKSYLLRSVLADAGIEPRAGIAFPPLGVAPGEPIEALLAELGADGGIARRGDALGARLAAAATAAGRTAPALLVVDDVHWADPDSLAALRAAILASDPRVPLVWLLVARSAELGRLRALTALADVTVELPPLRGEDRVRLLRARLGGVPPRLAAHVREGRKRGNPLYLEHLSAWIAEGGQGPPFPADLHEAVLARLEGLGGRVRELTRWEYRTADPRRGVEALEREVGDWLDRLETSDLADLATIGRYLGKLRQVDFELVLARSILGLPVATSRRLAQAIERLAAASTDALLDYLEDMAAAGHGKQAVAEAESAAQRAVAALRLADAELLLGFAAANAAAPGDLLRRRGDVALALGDAEAALASYAGAAESGAAGAELERRMARAESTAGDSGSALRRLARAAVADDVGEVGALRLDGCRLRGEAPPPERFGVAVSPSSRRLRARVAALASPGGADLAAGAAARLIFDGDPLACAAELVETAAVAALGGVAVTGLRAGAEEAAQALGNRRAAALLRLPEPRSARQVFLHAEV